MAAQMVAMIQDTGVSLVQTFFAGELMKKTNKKPVAKNAAEPVKASRGKPPSRTIILDELRVAINTLTDAVAHLKDGVKQLSDNGVPGIYMCADTELSKTIPRVNEFARNLYMLTGPAIHANATNQQTEAQRQRAKYERQKRNRKPPESK